MFCDTEDVNNTVYRVLDQDDCIADGSTHYKLPTIRGKHSDLKSITSETVSLSVNRQITSVHHHDQNTPLQVL